MTEVRCTVNSCKFWGEGEVCLADTIWVNNNLIASSGDDLPFVLDTELAGDLETDQTSLAQTSRHTCCETMRPRHQEEQNDLPGSERGCCS